MNEATFWRMEAERHAKPSTRPVLYISGPMTGKPEFNYPAFREAAKALRAEGWEVVDPSEHFGGRTDLPRHKHLAADVVALVTRCSAIVLLDGWRDSEGVKLEAQIALDRGYPLYRWGPCIDRLLLPMSRQALEAHLA